MGQIFFSIYTHFSSIKGHNFSTQALYASSKKCIIDYGILHHLTHSPLLFPSTSKCSFSHIQVGHSTYLDVLVLGTVELDDRRVNDVPLFLEISTNLLYIY
jgi:hypothetical protein